MRVQLKTSRLMNFRKIEAGLRKSALVATAPLLLAHGFGSQAQTNQPVTVNSDKSVTITYIDPDATQVEVQGTFFKKETSMIPIAGMFSKDGKAEMTNNGNGVWTYTSEPLASELYWYNFVIDEDSVRCDLRNKNTTRDIGDIYNYFIITGGIADDYADAESREGRLDYVWYPSKLNGMSRRRMAVYLPYGYSSSSRKYPVLYLLHGSGGDETAWPDCGRLCQIMDHLIADGRCQPMIVVMPNGNVELAAAPGEDPDNPDVEPLGNNVTSMFGKFENSFVDEVVAYVDKNYRTMSDKQHRAIAGLSLGGLHALYISLNEPDAFDYTGLFSAQTTNALGDKGVDKLKKLGDRWNRLKQSLPFVSGSTFDRKISVITGGRSDEDLETYENFDAKLQTFFSKKPKLFYIAVGTADFTKKLNDDLRKKLKQNNYPFFYNETDGGHTWSNWRKYLVDYLPRLFNN